MEYQFVLDDMPNPDDNGFWLYSSGNVSHLSEGDPHRTLEIINPRALGPYFYDNLKRRALVVVTLERMVLGEVVWPGGSGSNPKGDTGPKGDVGPKGDPGPTIPMNDIMSEISRRLLNG